MAMNIADMIQKDIEKAVRGQAGKTPKEPKKAAPKEPDFDEEASITEIVPENENQQLFSKVFGFLPLSGIDHTVTCYKQEDWSVNMQTFIPKKRAEYVWQQEALEHLAVGVEIGDNIWISGPTGSGKSTLIEQYCAYTCRPFLRFNGREDTESAPIFGQLVAENGSTLWKDGLLTEGVKNGAMVLMDEATVIPPGIMMGLQWLLEDEGKLMLTDKPGTVEEKITHPDSKFRLVFGDNTKGLGDDTGKYASTNVFNTATLDRFGTSIHLDYLASAHEVEILKKKYPSLKNHMAEKMVKFAHLVRTANQQEEISLTMSPRTLLSWAKKSLYYKNEKIALQTSFYEKLDSDSEKAFIRASYQTVFGKSF